MSDLLKGAPLFRNKDGGKQITSEELKGKVVVLFFGAKEAGKELNDKLKVFYEINASKGLEVVYISHDNNAEEMKAFMKDHPAWTYIQYGHPKAISLFQRYQLSAIPSLLVVQRGGTPVVKDAVNEVYYQDANAVFAKWRKLTTE